jgi:hypothetical protein
VSLPVPDSGQTGCYWNNGSTWTADASCAQSYVVGDANKPYGQDAHYANKPTARSFTGSTQYGATTDYTTKDNVTGLTWKTCSEGQTWNGTTCTGTASTMTWYSAVNGCAALNTANSGAGYSGRTDWRLPTRAELESLPDYSTSNPAIDAAKFPATVARYYWSSTAFASDPADAWVVSFGDGDSGYDDRTVSSQVRCVAGP